MRYRVYAILHLILLVFYISRPVIPYIQYAIFKDYIAKNLCVNKDKPKSCCHGKCFLDKQIKAVDENINKNTNNNSNNNKKAENNDIKEFLCFYLFTFKPVALDLIPRVYWEASKMPGFAAVFFVPPKFLLKKD